MYFVWISLISYVFDTCAHEHESSHFCWCNVLTGVSVMIKRENEHDLMHLRAFSVYFLVDFDDIYGQNALILTILVLFQYNISIIIVCSGSTALLRSL